MMYGRVAQQLQKE